MCEILKTSYDEFLAMFGQVFGQIHTIQAKLAETDCTPDQKRAINEIELRLNHSLNNLQKILVDLESLGGAQ